MKRKQLIQGCASFLGMLLLILDAQTALQGAQSGIELCLRTVIPSLLPFFVLSAFLTDAVSDSSLPLLHPIGNLIGIPGGAESLLLIGFLAGYPVGAQCVTDAWRRGRLTKAEAERMLPLCSNAGPAFLFGMVGSLFPFMGYVWLLWGIQILGAFLSALVLPSCGTRIGQNHTASGPVGVPNLLKNAMNAMANVCCWVILFRIIIYILKGWILWIFPVEVQMVLYGILELTNGCMELSTTEDIGLRFLLASGFLSCGGLCVTMQVVSAVEGLSMRYYAIGKGVQTLFCLSAAAALSQGFWYPLVLLLTGTLFIRRKIRKRSRNHGAVVV